MTTADDKTKAGRPAQHDDGGWHLPWDRKTLEERVRRMVSDQVETPKIDTKQSLDLSTKAAKVELVKDISAMANSDDQDHHEDHGFIIFGAEAGAVVGGVALLDAGKLDNTSASVSQLIDQYLGPTPRIHLIGFTDATTGPWGVLVIPPSGDQPHIFIRASDGPKVGDWFVRINDTTARATPADYVRTLSKATARAIGPFERKMQELESRLVGVEHRPVGSVPALSGAPRSSTPRTIPTTGPTADRLRRELAGPEADMDDMIVQDALGLMSQLGSSVPWVLHRGQQEEAASALDKIEALTEPVARTFATVARYDGAGRYTDSVRRAAGLLATIPRPGPGVGYTDDGAAIRVYPFVLCFHAVLCASIRERRTDLVEALLSVRARIDPISSESRPAIWAVTSLHWAGAVFSCAKGGRQRQFIPHADRLMARVTEWTGELLLGESPRDTFLVSEFLTTLVSLAGHATTHPIPGVYLYLGEAKEAIRRFLLEKPDWLDPLFPKGLSGALAAFDQGASDLLDREAFHASGFLGGAVAAYEGRPDES